MTFEELLARDGRLTYRTKGTSMEPMLKENRDLITVGVPSSRLKRFDVALYKRKYAEAFKTQFEEQDAIRGHRLIQPHEKGFLVQNPPQPPLSTAEMDAVYALPFTRRPCLKFAPGSLACSKRTSTPRCSRRSNTARKGSASLPLAT